MNNDNKNKMPLAFFLLGFSGGFRIEIPVFLLPAMIYAILSKNCRSDFYKANFIAIIMYVIGLLTWLIPQSILCNGFVSWLNATLNRF